MDVDRFIRVDNRWGDKSFLFLIVEIVGEVVKSFAVNPLNELKRVKLF